MKDFFDEFERIFSSSFIDEDDFFGPRRSYKIEHSNFESPFLDMWETQKDILIIFDLPAVEKQHIDVTIEKNVLTLKANIDKNNGFFTKIHLPTEVLANKIESKFKNGVLEVVIPKKNVSKSAKVN